MQLSKADKNIYSNCLNKAAKAGFEKSIKENSIYKEPWKKNEMKYILNICLKLLHLK